MMTFFSPEDTFLAWLHKHAAGRVVFDVGTGNGVFLRRMQHAGIRAIGIEPFPEFSGLDKQLDMISSYICVPVEECAALRTTTNALVLFCRPSHNGWVALGIPYVHTSSEILYISKPHNLEIDLPETAVEEVAAPGIKEKVWRIRRDKNRSVATSKPR